jgi:tRNA(Ile)-lysidine synthase
MLAAWPPERWRDVTALIAVSGGADSVVLLRLLVELRLSGQGRLVVAHFNHRLRGPESDADQQFVEDLAALLGLQVVMGAAASDLTAVAGGIGLEAAARQARYDFFAAAAAEQGARYVATAHTADDQAETVLLNILRGTGLAGLAGIPRIRQLSTGTTVIRPLLDATRDEVLSYLREIGQAFREDSTNAELHFTRNRVRNELLPLLERDFHRSARQSLLRLAQVASQTTDFLNREAQPLAERAVRPVNCGFEIDRQAVVSAHPVLVRQLLLAQWQRQQWPLQDMTLEKWEQLVQLALVPTNQSPVTYPGAILAQRLGKWLRITRDRC